MSQKKTIAVIGATGQQGKGVVDALVEEGTFHVRAITRNPDTYSGKAHEVVKGDLHDLEAMTKAFDGAYGVFAMTNFWEGGDESAQGKTAVDAAKAANVSHFVWSTVPNAKVISNGAFDMASFNGKVAVDSFVAGAGFAYHTFVQPPFYYQNFTSLFAPQGQQDGSTGWTLPIDPTSKSLHLGDIHDMGKVVAGAFLSPERVGHGNYLAFSTELVSFEDVQAAFRAHGKEYSFHYVPKEVFAGFFEGADEIAQLFAYFEAHSYHGMHAQESIQHAKDIAIGEFTSLHDWIGQNV